MLLLRRTAGSKHIHLSVSDLSQIKLALKLHKLASNLINTGFRALLASRNKDVCYQVM